MSTLATSVFHGHLSFLSFHTILSELQSWQQAREPELHTLWSLKQEGKTITYTIITNQDIGHSQRRELTGDFLSSLCFKLLGVGCCLILMPVLLSAIFQECHQSLVNTASRKEEHQDSGDKSMGCLGTVTASCVEEGWVMHSVLFWLLSCWLLETVLRWQQKLVIFSMSLSSVTAPHLRRVQLPSSRLWTALSNGVWPVLHRNGRRDCDVQTRS